MNDAHLGIQPHRSMGLLWPLLFVGGPALVAAWEARVPPGKARLEAVAAARFRRPATPPPAVAPVEVYALERDQARALNAAIPFSRLPIRRRGHSTYQDRPSTLPAIGRASCRERVCKYV